MEFSELARLNLPIAVLVAFFVAVLAVPALRPLAESIGLVDHPDRRKQHDRPTPLTGGMAIVLGLAVGIMMLPGVGWSSAWTLLVGALVLLVVGLLDDLFELSATLRLLVQIGVAVLMVYGGGLQLNVMGPLLGPAVGSFGLGPFAGIFTVACVVFMINAINMMDGLDGLAGGVAFIILALLFAVALLDGAPQALVLLPLVLAASTAGFLVWNLRRPIRPCARAFLGDTGSTVLGFTVAWLAVTLGSRPGQSVYPIAIAWLLLIPAMDTLALFIRRLAMGRSPFAPDRAHLHHIIHRCGYGVSTTVCVLYTIVLITGLVGLLGWQMGVPPWLLFAGAFAVLVSYPLALINAHRILRWQHRLRARRNAAAIASAAPAASMSESTSTTPDETSNSNRSGSQQEPGANMQSDSASERDHSSAKESRAATTKPKGEPSYSRRSGYTGTDQKWSRR